MLLANSLPLFFSLANTTVEYDPSPIIFPNSKSDGDFFGGPDPDADSLLDNLDKRLDGLVIM
jgi:hypothetical protein